MLDPGPAERAIAIVLDAALPVGVRGVLCSEDCTLSVRTRASSVAIALPFQKGYNPISITMVETAGTVLGTASIYALL